MARQQLALATAILIATLTSCEASESQTAPPIPELAEDSTTDTAPLPPVTQALADGPQCSSVEFNFAGFFKGYQEEGDIFLSSDKPPPKILGERHGFESSSTESTTDTAQSEARVKRSPETVTQLDDTTEAGTTIAMEYTRTGITDKPFNSTPCVAPMISDGRQYNWWQILVEVGGKAGAWKTSRRPWTMTDSEPAYQDPCARPLQALHEKIEYTYHYRDTDRNTFFRFERSYPRFKGTAAYFEDVRGRLLWLPPPRANDSRGYSVYYVLDDTGFWVHVEKTDCEFGGGWFPNCRPLRPCHCYMGQIECEGSKDSLPRNLLASLLGGR